MTYQLIRNISYKILTIGKDFHKFLTQKSHFAAKIHGFYATELFSGNFYKLTFFISNMDQARERLEFKPENIYAKTVESFVDVISNVGGYSNDLAELVRETFSGDHRKWSPEVVNLAEKAQIVTLSNATFITALTQGEGDAEIDPIEFENMVNMQQSNTKLYQVEIGGDNIAHFVDGKFKYRDQLVEFNRLSIEMIRKKWDLKEEDLQEAYNALDAKCGNSLSEFRDQQASEAIRELIFMKHGKNIPETLRPIYDDPGKFLLMANLKGVYQTVKHVWNVVDTFEGSDEHRNILEKIADQTCEVYMSRYQAVEDQMDQPDAPIKVAAEIGSRTILVEQLYWSTVLFKASYDLDFLKAVGSNFDMLKELFSEAKYIARYVNDLGLLVSDADDYPGMPFREHGDKIFFNKLSKDTSLFAGICSEIGFEYIFRKDELIEKFKKGVYDKPLDDLTQDEIAELDAIRKFQIFYTFLKDLNEREFALIQCAGIKDPSAVYSTDLINPIPISAEDLKRVRENLRYVRRDNLNKRAYCGVMIGDLDDLGLGYVGRLLGGFNYWMTSLYVDLGDFDSTIKSLEKYLNMEGKPTAKDIRNALVKKGMKYFAPRAEA